MSSKPVKEDRDTIQLLPRCVVIYLKDRKRRKHEGKKDEASGGETSSPNVEAEVDITNDADRVVTGKALFEEFQEANKECYWNPHLEESIQSIKYVGCLGASTILVGGRDIYLDTVRSAWCRKVLRPPRNFSISKVGEIGETDMTLVLQNQFTPLPEALCLIVWELNHEGSAATLSAIQAHLGDKFKGMQQPTEQMVYEMLGVLIEERKIYLNDHAYHIVTPDTYRTGAHLAEPEHKCTPEPIPTVYIPVLTPQCSEMRSISCQTEQKSNEEKAAEKELDKTTEKEEKRKSRLERSNSVKSSKSKKEKKEELAFSRSTSLRYGEEKALALVKDINLKTSEAHQDKDKGQKHSLLNKIFGRNKKVPLYSEKAEGQDKAPVEYATFSAQFPPPDLQWSESNIQSLIKQQLPKSATWHHGTSPPSYEQIEASTQSEHSDQRASTLPVSMDSSSHGLCVPRSASAHSAESQNSSAQFDIRASKKSSKKTKRSRSGGRKEDAFRRTERLDSYDSYFSQTDSSNIYCEPDPATMEHSFLDNRLSMHSSHGKNENKKAEVLRRDLSHDESSALRRRSHNPVSCTQLCGDDISIEYHGRLAKRNTLYSMSRDSGVNCIGLNEANSKSSSQNKHKRSHRSSMHSDHQRPKSVLSPNNHQMPGAAGAPTAQLSPLHYVPDVFSGHQDSGFSSPRTDTETYAPHVNNQPVFYGQNNTPYNNHHHHYHKSSDKRHRHPSASRESVFITGSEKYPSMNHLSKTLDFEGTLSPNSSASSSSRLTVLDNKNSQQNNNNNKHPYACREEEYVEIHCPLHQDSGPSSPRKHKSRDSNRHHSHRRERSPNKYEVAKRNLREELSSYGSDHQIAGSAAYSQNHQRSLHDSDPRLAFLSDSQVIGVV